MTTKQTAQQLELAAQILRTGHPWEYQPDHFNWKKSEGFDPLYALSQRWPIRLVLATPPDNRPLHNPDNLTVEQVGAGWRLLVVGEKQTPGYQYRVSANWFSGYVFDEVVDVCNGDTTCRIPLSTPWPEAEKPDPYTELKPDFNLPPPPPGMQWHREDGWTAEMLPQGYRPVIFGEQATHQSTESMISNGSWIVQSGNYDIADCHRTSFIRTTRPLVFTHEGKTWTWHRPGDPMPTKGGSTVVQLLLGDGGLGKTERAGLCLWSTQPSKSNQTIGWRYAEPETKTVELGPEDVPPGSVFLGAGEIDSKGWCLIISCSDVGIRYWRHSDPPGCGKEYPWSELHSNGSQINRSIPLTGKWNPDAWEPCHKPANPPQPTYPLALR